MNAADSTFHVGNDYANTFQNSLQSSVSIIMPCHIQSISMVILVTLLEKARIGGRPNLDGVRVRLTCLADQKTWTRCKESTHSGISLNLH